MKYENMREGIFRERPNRFIAHVEIDGKMEICHVKNTGRCRELLLPGARVWLEHHDSAKRKTAYSLIGVYKGEILVNLDSQAPNQVAEEWLREGSGDRFGKMELVRREVTYGASRFDLYFEYEDGDGARRRAFMEVKGVTLEEDGVARFPDAPTERGVKHVKELEKCLTDGYEAYLLFVVQMDGTSRFEANRPRHGAFADALAEAHEAGVQILAYDCQVEPDSLRIRKELPVAYV